MQVGEGDFFWDENGRSQFPKVAEEVDLQLQKYKQVTLLFSTPQEHESWKSNFLNSRRSAYSMLLEVLCY